MGLLPETAMKLLRQRLPELAGVYLYGSRVHGGCHSESDWDIGVLGKQPYEAMLLLDVASELAMLLAVEHVDLVDMYTASSVLVYQVLSEGRCLWEGDSLFVGNFELKSLGLYFDLNIERAGILEDIKQRGRVLGKNG